MNNSGIILITYPDSLGRDIRALHGILNDHFKSAVAGVHLLPFFPSSGDRGFAPITYDAVAPAFGDWADVEALARDYALTADFMINHISAQSVQYRDFLEKGKASPYADYFIDWASFWGPEGPTEAQAEMIYKRKPRMPYVEAAFRDGTGANVWCTFSEEQIDLDCFSPVCRLYIAGVLDALCERGIRRIRLDAFAYATKKKDTNCFFVEPEIWELLDFCRDVTAPFGAEVLPEIHEHYSIQQKLADHGYAPYDFALPMLLLHALYYGEAKYLKSWLAVCPRRQFTTLDTHDGIGVVDVRGLLPDAEIEKTKDDIFRRGANVKRVYSSSAYHNLDIYQVNCTYYSALGDDDGKYLVARAVQFFAPGTPMVYYVGLLAGKNDIALLEKTREGRDINRHAFDTAEIAREVERPVVKKLLALMALRNAHPAFDGTFRLLSSADREVGIRWENGGDWAELRADVAAARATILYTDGADIGKFEI